MIGCKRLCVDTGYYATFNRPNVHLVDLTRDARSSASRRPASARPPARYELDAIVFATGFDAMTGALLAHRHPRPRRRGARATPGPQARAPTSASASHGFPNLFTVTGPGSPSVLTNMIVSIEQHVEWIADCHRHLRDDGPPHASRPTLGAQDAWVDTSTRSPTMTLFPSCNSWYLGANVPGKPRVFMPLVGFAAVREQCEEIVAKGYEGFALR